MDMFEQMARDLAEAQRERYKKARGKHRAEFYADPKGVEMGIANVISDMERMSRTFKYESKAQ